MIEKLLISVQPRWIYPLVFCLFAIFPCVLFADNSLTTAAQGGAYPAYPAINYGTGAQEALIKRGEYLAQAGDCIACHTNGANAKPFAGGLPIKTPFGTIYSPNITPDKETGIGNWTDEQFYHAMHEGIAPNGSFYFPVFPYPNFNKMSKEDVLAIKAYLMAVPAVHQENKPVDMPIPFRWRFLQTFWRLLFFDLERGQYVPNPHKSAEWNTGAYLVLGLGHCGMCHTPLNFLGAPKNKYALTGGFVDGFYAPNITATNLKNTPVDDVVNVFLKDKLIGGGDVQGPMLEVNHDSLVHLDKEDLSAIAMYLQTVKSKIPPKPKAPEGVSIEAGKKVYDQYCAGCHTNGAGGAPKIGDKAAWAPRIQLGLNELYKNAIAGIDGMPPKGTCASCSTNEIQSAVQYIVSESKSAPGAVTATTAAAPSPTSLAKGQEVYQRVCSVCHAQGQLGAPKMGDKEAWSPILNQSMDILFEHAIKGYKGMPPKGSCYDCSDADVIAAVKYMVQQSKSEGDYDLWSGVKNARLFSFL